MISFLKKFKEIGNRHIRIAIGSVMTSSTPTQVHHTVGNDLGGTPSPSAELGWGGLAPSAGSRREGQNFQQLSRLMGEAEMEFEHIATLEVGGPLESDRIPRSVIDHSQRTGTIVKQVGGLEITSEPIFSRSIGNVVFIDQEVPGGSN